MIRHFVAGAGVVGSAVLSTAFFYPASAETTPPAHEVMIAQLDAALECVLGVPGEIAKPCKGYTTTPLMRSMFANNRHIPIKMAECAKMMNFGGIDHKSINMEPEIELVKGIHPDRSAHIENAYCAAAAINDGKDWMITIAVNSTQIGSDTLNITAFSAIIENYTAKVAHPITFSFETHILKKLEGKKVFEVGSVNLDVKPSGVITTTQKMGGKTIMLLEVGDPDRLRLDHRFIQSLSSIALK